MKAVSTAASTVRHTFGVASEALLILAIVGALVFAAATLTGTRPAGGDSVFAARGGNGNGGGNAGAGAVASGISLDQAGQALSLGSSVTFTTTVGDLTGNEYALVYLKCTQGDTVVYGQLALPGTTFVLGGGSSPWWQVGGPASCMAYLYAYGTHGGSDTIRELATTPTFSAN